MSQLRIVTHYIGFPLMLKCEISFPQKKENKSCTYANMHRKDKAHNIQKYLPF